MYTVYGLIDLRNEQLKYIGVTKKKLKDRLNFHLGEARNFRRPTKRLLWLRELLDNNIRPEVFDIETVTDEERFPSEQFWIAYFQSIGANLVNGTRGGAGTFGLRMGEDSRAKMRASAKNLTPEQRKRKSDSHKGKKRSDEFKRKISEANRKRRLSPETRAKISASVSRSLIGNTRALGFKHTEETKEKLRTRKKERDAKGKFSIEADK